MRRIRNLASETSSAVFCSALYVTLGKSLRPSPNPCPSRVVTRIILGKYFLNSSVVYKLDNIFIVPVIIDVLPLPVCSGPPAWMSRLRGTNGCLKYKVWIASLFFFYYRIFFLKNFFQQDIGCFAKGDITECPCLKDPVDMKPHDAQGSIFLPPGLPFSDCTYIMNCLPCLCVQSAGQPLSPT